MLSSSNRNKEKKRKGKKRKGKEKRQSYLFAPQSQSKFTIQFSRALLRRELELFKVELRVVGSIG